MRIAFVTETWQPAVNGIVTRLEFTARELLRRGHEVLILAPGGSQPASGDIEVRTVPAVGLPFVYGGQPWGLPLPRTRHLLGGFEPDGVVTPPRLCPKCHGESWERFAKPGSILDNANRY